MHAAFLRCPPSGGETYKDAETKKAGYEQGSQVSMLQKMNQLINGPRKGKQPPVVHPKHHPAGRRFELFFEEELSPLPNTCPECGQADGPCCEAAQHFCDTRRHRRQLYTLI